MKNTKKRSSIFDESVKEAVSDFAKEMGRPITDKNDTIPFAGTGNTLSKISAFIKSKKIQSVRQAKLG